MIKTWQQRCEEHPDHEGIVSEGMIMARMQEEIDELRERIDLTDEEIKEIVGQWGDTPIKGYTRKLFDQIEAKLREKNA